MKITRTHNFFGTEILKSLTILLGTASLVGILGITLWNSEGLAQVSSSTSTRINVPSAVSTTLLRSCPVGFSQFTEQQEASDEAADAGCYNQLVDSRIDIDNQICTMSCGTDLTCLAKCWISDRYTCLKTLIPQPITDPQPAAVSLSCGPFAKPSAAFYKSTNLTDPNPANYHYLCCGFYRPSQ